MSAPARAALVAPCGRWRRGTSSRARRGRGRCGARARVEVAVHQVRGCMTPDTGASAVKGDVGLEAAEQGVGGAVGEAGEEDAVGVDAPVWRDVRRMRAAPERRRPRPSSTRWGRARSAPSSRNCRLRASAPSSTGSRRRCRCRRAARRSAARRAPRRSSPVRRARSRRAAPTVSRTGMMPVVSGRGSASSRCERSRTAGSRK